VNNEIETGKPLSVLIITSSFPYFSSDLSGNFIWNKSKYLIKNGLSVVVLCPHKVGTSFYEEREGVIIYRFPYVFPFRAQRLTSQGGMIHAIRSSPLIALQILPYLLSCTICAIVIVLKYKPDILHTHWIIPNGIVGSYIHSIFHIPHMSSIHGTDINISAHNPLFSRMVKIIAKYTTTITANSSFTRDAILRLLPKRRDITIIPMGINCEPVFSDTNNKMHFLSDQGTQTILFVGRLINWKGVEVLINALKTVSKSNPRVRLVIVGEGPLRKDFVKLTEVNGLESIIHFTGQVPDSVLKEYYARSSLFVLPSILLNNQTEGLGVVLLEAMAAGVPVIGSDTGGIPDIIENEVNGLLVPPGDPKVLAEAIIRILSLPELGDQFREAGIKTVKEKYSWDIIVKQFIKKYTESLTNKS